MKVLFFVAFTLGLNGICARDPLVIFSERRMRGGPLQIQNNLLRGLSKNNYPFMHNPQLTKTTEAAVVLSNDKVAANAIELKKRGLIKYLFVGPNISYLPNNNGGILKHPQIDIVLVPSEWVKNSYEQDAPCLNGKVKVWYGGVDANYWAPSADKKPTKNVLVYNKRGPEWLLSGVQSILRNYGYNPMLLSYGSYTHNDYKTKLEQSDFAIILSPSESQGIALAEGWSMNVPTLAWEPHNIAVDSSGHQFSVSSAPYLTEHTGARWTNLEEFDALIDSIDMLLPTFAPRAWVLEHMTQEKSAQLLTSIVESYAAEKLKN